MAEFNLNDIKDSIVDKHINNDDGLKYGCALPNRKIITRFTINLMEIVFPGYFTNCRNINMERHISNQLNMAFETLIEQLGIALNLEEEKTTEIALQFMSKLPMVIEYAHSDLEEAFLGDPAATDKNIIIATYPGIFATTIQRLAHELYLLKVPYIPRIMTEYAHGKTGIDIHPGATIGKYFFIDHGTGVVIGETTEIGEHVKIYQGVTLGAKSTKDGQGLRDIKRHPTIMNNVTIYSDASVLGGNTVIGDGVTIAGNAFITKSISKNEKGGYFDYII